MTIEIPKKATLTLQHSFCVSAEKVYLAWTNPNIFKQWFGPTGFQVLQVTSDVCVGGKFHIQMIGPDQTHYHIRGVYHVVDLNRRLVFTWQWDGPIRNQTETLVEVLFQDLQERTELTLKHFYLPNENEVKGHRSGWSGSFASLENHILKENSV